MRWLAFLLLFSPCVALAQALPIEQVETALRVARLAAVNELQVKDMRISALEQQLLETRREIERLKKAVVECQQVDSKKKQ